MSRFLFGEIHFQTERPMRKLRAFAWKASELARDSRLHVCLDCLIPQALVFEMLPDRQLGERRSKLPFLLTDSPLSDTSEELAAALSQKDAHGDAPSVGEQLDTDVQGFLTNLFASEGTIQRIDLYLTEGYDNQFHTYSILSDRFNELIHSLDFTSFEMESTKIILSRST